MMGDEVAMFFPPGAKVFALPTRSVPRLYLASKDVVQRWRHAGFYPAFRWTAQAYRASLRIRAALGLDATQLNTRSTWLLERFLDACVPGVDASVVSIGTHGPARKITVQLWGGHRVLGYLKYAHLPAAQARLEHEHQVLTQLPANMGPKVLKYGPLAAGYALVTAPVAGRSVSPTLPLRSSLQGFLAGLWRSESWLVERHPWARVFRARHGSTVDQWLEVLADTTWPVVFQHGDFAPWNIHKDSEGNLAAIDWEYGDPKGFPHLDAAYYVLQVSALIRRWQPARARAFGVRHLSRELPHAQAEALMSLAAFQAYSQALDDGHTVEEPLQVWRRAVWGAT